jgi:hypothetical protein
LKSQSVYAIFKSKTGILLELVDQSTFGPGYEESVHKALSAKDGETRLRLAAPIARQIHDAQSATSIGYEVQVWLRLNWQSSNDSENASGTSGRNE